MSIVLADSNLLSESSIRFNSSIELKRTKQTPPHDNAKRPRLHSAAPESERFPSSRPISPREQIETMESVEREISKHIGEPSDLDAERYKYYIEHGPERSMIAPLPRNQFDIFYALISPELRNQPFMREFEPSLIDEVHRDYEYSMRKAILDYCLLNFDERRRVKIEWVPRPFVLK